MDIWIKSMIHAEDTIFQSVFGKKLFHLKLNDSHSRSPAFGVALWTMNSANLVTR